MNLVVQVAMGVALIAGAFLARAKRYTAYGIYQTAVLLLAGCGVRRDKLAWSCE